MLHAWKTTRILRFLTHKAPSKSSCLMFGKCPTRTLSAPIRGYLNTTSGKVRFCWYLNCCVRARRTAGGLCQPRLCAADHAVSYLAYGTYVYLHICGRCVRLTTLPPSCAVVMKSGNLNFLEPSGPLQADLPLQRHKWHNNYDRYRN